MARVQILEARPLQCFRCLEGGHVRATCGGVDRSTRCYRCGDLGHKAQNCSAQLCCPVCTDLGRPANHRAGSRVCAPAHRRGRGKSREPMMPLPPRINPIQRGSAATCADTDTVEPAVEAAPTAELTTPRIVEDVTFTFEHEPLPQRPRCRLSWASLCSRPSSPGPASSMSIEREGTEDPGAASSVRDA